MSLWKYLGFGKQSAQDAKNRLQVIIAQQRVEKNSPDYLPMMRKEIIAIIMKYTQVDSGDIHVDVQCKENDSMLELNVSLPQLSLTTEAETQ